MDKKKKAALWDEARQKCRLSDEAIQMAKGMGMSPKRLISNIPNQSEPWKAPVETWIRNLYQEKMEKAAARRARREAEAAPKMSPGERSMEMEGFEREDAETFFEEDFEDYGEEDDDYGRPSRSEIDEENKAMMRRHVQFRRAAEYVTWDLQKHAAVLRIALIGSVAIPLEKEVPRFRRLRRSGTAIWHECRDIDLAIWMDRFDRLDDLRRTLAKATNRLFAEHDIGVANHQFDVFLLEPGTNRYRGRLCHFGSCPRDYKRECRTAGCGLYPFLKQIKGFEFDPLSLLPECTAILFDRDRPEPSSPAQFSESDDDIPF